MTIIKYMAVLLVFTAGLSAGALKAQITQSRTESGLNKKGAGIQPYGPVPTPRQLKWQDDELYAFAHFGVNTFTGKEWGEGNEAESVFNPTDFDAAQIVKAVKDGGFKGLILTVKHHDGFCLWPSAYTEHSVKNSKWKNGKGDVVREISEACKKQGIRFGIYLSPWDRNHADYGKPAYLIYYVDQLRELLTNYGPIFEVWLDGANGGKGYYGGANEDRKVNVTSYYQWPDTWVSLIRKLQPDCCVHSDFGPDNRWGGNEDGSVGVPCWSTLLNKDLTFNTIGEPVRNAHGERPGDLWVPAESDVSIRPGWFYHPEEDTSVKSAVELMNIYYTSVGRGAGLLLNIPPGKRGQINEADVKALKAFKALKEKTFAVNLAKRASLKASNVRAGNKQFGAMNLLDNNPETFWCTDDGVLTPQVSLSFAKPVTFDLVNIQEYIQLGQRIDAYELDLWKSNQWVPFFNGNSIGHRALIKLDHPITSKKIRLKIKQAAASPAIAAFGLYKQPV